jgi:hypothetical protein
VGVVDSIPVVRGVGGSRETALISHTVDNPVYD